MTKRAQSADGVFHEFPAETPDEVIDRAMREYVIGEEEEKPTTKAEQAWRGIQMAGRMLTETPALTGAFVADVASKGVNVGISALDKAGQAIGDKPLDYRLPTDRTQTVYQGFTDMGFPEPNPTEERYGRFTAGAMLPIKGGQMMQQSASPVTRAVGETLATKPGGQYVRANTAAAAGQGAEELGAGPGVQMAAEFAGGAAPDIARYGGGAAARRIARGPGGPQPVSETIQTFERAGTTPTAGQATENRLLQANEGAMSRTPGGAGRMVNKAETQATEVAAFIEDRATQLAGRTSAEQAGRTIERGISGEGGFIDRFRATQNRLYTELEELVPDHTQAPMRNTVDLLEDMTGTIPGATNVSRELANPAIERIYTSLMDDLALSPSGRLPFSALMKLRSTVGRRLETVTIVDDVPRAEWKRLYGALSRDMDEIIGTNDPEALQAYRRANNHTKSGHARIERIENVIKKKGGPEKIFAAATSGTKEGATVLHGVMQSLNKEEQKVLTATIMRRLGKATPGAQNELGDVFSMERFLTNWNGLSVEAKRTLFDRYGPSFRADIDAIAKMAANIRTGSRVFQNPSRHRTGRNSKHHDRCVWYGVVNG